MENKDALDVAFFFNQDIYVLLNDDEKMNLLLVIQELLDAEMQKLILTIPKKLS